MAEYKIHEKDLLNFLALIKKFHPGMKWKISRSKISVTTDDPENDVKLFQHFAHESDFLVFEKTIDDSRTAFRRAFPIQPETDFVLTPEDEIFATIIAENYRTSGEESYMIPLELANMFWERVAQIMQAVRKRMNLTTWYLMPKTGMLYMLSDSFAMVVVKDHVSGKTFYRQTCYNDQYTFDIVDGFRLWGMEDESVPVEMVEDFNLWVKQGRNPLQPVLRNHIG
jgi:hypothetical protein